MNRAHRAARIGKAARLIYRADVVSDSGGDPDWHDPDWLDYAACGDNDPVDVDECRSCPVRWACLTAALVLDDPAEIRARFTRSARRVLFGLLEVDATADEPWLLAHPGRTVEPSEEPGLDPTVGVAA